MASAAGCGGGRSHLNTANLSADELLQRARSSLDRENYEDALTYYRAIEARFPYGRHAEQAQIDTAYLNFLREEPELAVAAADRFIHLHPTHPRVDYAYYLKGLASFREKKGFMARVTGTNDLSTRDPQPARNALAAFRELVNRYPDSPYAQDARQRVTYLLNSLAQHDVSVARYYLSRGAYVAVVNRAKYVIENYQTTPSVEDALGLMAIAYDEMGLDMLRTDTVRVLEANFPDSAYLQRPRG
jgi:outer membrane protein assembly factor BamD